MILVVGGARSGKSTFAVDLALSWRHPVRVIATARAEDEEMERRIAAHRDARPEHWVVVEEPIHLADALMASDMEETVIVDCLTLWVSNLMPDNDDTDVFARVEEAIRAARGRRSIVVSNEVGSGIVPQSPVGRRFRDLQGWANQRFSVEADEAYVTIAGRALRLGEAVSE